MKKLFGSIAFAALMAGTAHAQTPPQSPTGSAPSPSQTDAGAPLPGANSFTEAQARTRIEKLGFTNVVGLTKDVDGIWRGKAMKDGKTQDVAVDYRGNIVVSQK